MKERDEDLFALTFKNNSTGFIEFRKEGALIGYAPDPLTSHECGNARYPVIPFFDYCLSKRLPQRAGNLKLKNMPKGIERPIPFLTGTKLNVWLPDEKFARKWEEFIQTGYVLDNTPPPAPENVKISGNGEITWDISADLESGLAGFIIERDGKEITYHYVTKLKELIYILLSFC